MKRRPDDSQTDWIARRTTQLLSRYAVACLVVDSSHRIVRFSHGPIRTYLNPSSGIASLDLFVLLRDVLHAPLRKALLQAATTDRTSFASIDAGRISHDGSVLDLVVEPVRAPPHSGDRAAPLFVVSFHPRPSHVDAGGASDDLPIADGTSRMRVQDDTTELQVMQFRMQNEDLQLSNRGLAVSRAQLQASIVQLQLGAAELGARNERLVRLNGDLSNLLDSTRIAILFLDSELRIRSFTNTMTELFALRGLDTGRPITDLSSQLDYPMLQADVEAVLGSQRRVEREVRDLEKESRVFLMRMRPYQVPDDDRGGVVVTFVDITARKRAEQQVWFLAHHDQLTGLPNRSMFRSALEQAIAESPRTGARPGLLYLDLDRFKTVNDTFGHGVGDRILQLASDRLLACVRPADMVCRLAGDEFAILPVPGQSAVALSTLAESILLAIAAPFEIDAHVVQIGVSIGIASSPPAAADADALIRAADIALYKAKAQGRNAQCTFQAWMEEEWQRRRMLEADLREAIERDELVLVYQPIVRLSDRAIVGVEALIRWRHRRYGLLAPASFIPIAEETGLIVPIGIWVLQTACREAAGWALPVPISVNLSSIQFASLDLVDTVRGAITAAGLAPSRLALEVTETMLLHDDVRTQEVLDALRQAGITIVMDDFGTGYSSLSYIRSFAIQKIKIDQAFTRMIDVQRESRVIVKAIVTIGDGLGIGICAEGVETEAQLAALQDWGVTEAQGFLLHKPMPPPAFSALLVSAAQPSRRGPA